MKIYVSSTYQDLRSYRSAVDLTLRRMGHDVIGMEQYVAEGTTPLKKCIEDIKSSDAYVLVLGWRYGYVPVDPSLNPTCLSITELEYRTACEAGKSVLAFLLDPEVPWPPSAFDALSQQGGERILKLRSDVGAAYLSGVFGTADNLASQVAAAVSRLGLSRQMVGRALAQASAGQEMAPFLRGDPLADTTLAGVSTMVRDAGGIRSLVIGLGAGDRWWSTRLYLLSALLQTLTPVRQLVFSNQDDSFAAMASVTALRQGLCDAFPPLAAFDSAIRPDSSLDVDREIERMTCEWHSKFQNTESGLKVGVRSHLLTSWIGERLITRCIRIPQDGELTRVHVQQIVDSLLPDVPVDWPLPEGIDPDTSERTRLMVVDRDAFALEIARQSVRAGMPQATIR